MPNQRALRIAVIAPPWFDIPPLAYGGIEWMCHWLVEDLIDRGHSVTLVAAGRNGTRAAFVQTYDEPPGPRVGEALPELVHAGHMATRVQASDFDVLHDHSLAGPLLAFGRAVPTIVTAHSPVTGELGRYYHSISAAVSLVAISDAQRRAAPDIPWLATVHNAIVVDDYPFREEKEDFVLFLGRMHPDKAPHLAIEAARAAGWPLVMAGKCSEPIERQYFDRYVAPLLGADARWIGQADTARKKDLLARARCLLFPIQWEEPFGIVMVEAMACGTPVVALHRGSVPEVVEDEVTGFVYRDITAFPEGIKRAELIDPSACRSRAMTYFDIHTMVDGYEAAYRKVTASPP